MNFPDPFYGYSILLRAIVFGAVPAFAIWQLFRLRRALHVFQLEGYKGKRFLQWSRNHLRRALFVGKTTRKKPLAMTGRAWRILVVAEILTVAGVLLLPAGAHLWLGGWPADVTTWAVVTAALFFGAPYVVVASDWLLAPVQRTINARYERAALSKLSSIDPVVIGITGSYGKTSTKFAVAHLVGSPGEALATPGSFNTPMGIVRAINERLEPDHRFFVVEMGAYGQGEIAELCTLARPNIGILTSVGTAHLERFGSREAIRRAKYELIESLPPDGTAVMNSDDATVAELARGTAHVDVIRFGLDAQAEPHLTARDVITTPRGTRLTVVDKRSGEEATVETRLLGRHAIGHILAATAAAIATGSLLRELGPRISTLEPVEHRLQIIEGTGGITVIDDAYNSNPEGAAAAFEVLDAMPGATKVIVTPGMIELGDEQFKANRELGRRAAEVADRLIVVAAVNRDALVAGAEQGGSAEIVTVDSLTQAQERLRGMLRPGDVVLFENDLPDQYEGPGLRATPP